MKTVASLTELQRHAAQTGASINVGGRVINAEGDKVAVAARKMPEPPAPMVAPEPVVPSVSMDEVERLLRERDEQWEKRLDTLSTAILMIGQKAPESSPDVLWNFVPEYGSKGEIVNLRAVKTVSN